MSILVQYRNDVPSVKVRLDALPLSIGRAEVCDLCLDDDLASRQHAVIERGTDGGLALRDLQSTNGTFVNGNRIEAHRLHDGDWVRIGRTFFKYEDAAHSDLAETKVIRKSIIPGVFYTTAKSEK